MRKNKKMRKEKEDSKLQFSAWGEHLKNEF